jgi:hypothetical protein
MKNLNIFVKILDLFLKKQYRIKKFKQNMELYNIKQSEKDFNLFLSLYLKWINFVIIFSVFFIYIIFFYLYFSIHNYDINFDIFKKTNGS